MHVFAVENQRAIAERVFSHIAHPAIHITPRERGGGDGAAECVAGARVLKRNRHVGWETRDELVDEQNSHYQEEQTKKTKEFKIGCKMEQARA